MNGVKSKLINMPNTHNYFKPMNNKNDFNPMNKYTKSFSGSDIQSNYNYNSELEERSNE